MRVFPIDMEDGRGAVLTTDITRIVPAHRKAGWSVIYTTSDPDGLVVKGNSNELCAVWHAYLEGLCADDFDSDDDGDDGLLDDSEDVSGAESDPDDQGDD